MNRKHLFHGSTITTVSLVLLLAAFLAACDSEPTTLPTLAATVTAATSNSAATDTATPTVVRPTEQLQQTAPTMTPTVTATSIPATATATASVTVAPSATAAPTQVTQQASATPLPSPSPTWTSTPVPTEPAVECLFEWFMTNPPDACSDGPAWGSFAARQQFERGRMIWVEKSDTFYILFNSGAHPFDGRMVFITAGPLVLKPGASVDNRVGEEPPAGLYEPVSGFGLLWRGEVEGLGLDLRQALGWAVEEEYGFQTKVQCQEQETYSERTCYLLDGNSSVIVLASHAIAGDVWWTWAGQPRE